MAATPWQGPVWTVLALLVVAAANASATSSQSGIAGAFVTPFGSLLPRANGRAISPRTAHVPLGHGRATGLRSPISVTNLEGSSGTYDNENGGEAAGQSEHDLFVLGAGTRGIGGRVIQEYRRLHPDAKIVGETKSSTYHPTLLKLGCQPRTCDDPMPNIKFPNVVISTPPSLSRKMLDASSEEEKEEFRSIVRRGVSMWDGSGKLVFTSAGSSYKENAGGTVTEESQVKEDHPMRQCERMVTDVGGTALRFSALYGFGRGGLWNLMGKTTMANPNMVLELCSYDDAGGAVISILGSESSQTAGKVFNVCDGQGLTAKQAFQCCQKVYEYRDTPIPEFKVGEDQEPTGKKFDTSKMRSLGWKPRWESFDAWCEAHSGAPNHESNEIIVVDEAPVKEAAVI